LTLAQDALAAAIREVPLFRFHALTRLAQLHLLQGDLTAAEDYIDQAKDDDLERPPVFFYATLVTEAELALRRADYGRAMTTLDHVLPTIRSAGIRIFVAQALYVQAQVYLELAQKGAAQTSLQEARAEAIATGSRADLWPILMTLSQLETDVTEAEQLRRQAQEIVESIAARTPTPELRAAFLSLPTVRSVFDPVTKYGRQCL
jgi:tetratricopeptide (TPR) repeat protein